MILGVGLRDGKVYEIGVYEVQSVDYPRLTNASGAYITSQYYAAKGDDGLWARVFEDIDTNSLIEHSKAEHYLVGQMMYTLDMKMNSKLATDIVHEYEREALNEIEGLRTRSVIVLGVLFLVFVLFGLCRSKCLLKGSHQ